MHADYIREAFVAAVDVMEELQRRKGLAGYAERFLLIVPTCPFCTGPWVAAALTVGLVARPRATRMIAGVLAMVTISDFLHHLYERTEKPSPAG